MPWSNQGGGGGWRGGSGGPWGSPPGGGAGGQPPDLEEILRRSQDRLKSVMPGGSMGGKGLLLILLVLVALWGFSGIYRVNTDEQGVVLRFGRYVSQTGPGLHYHLPYPIETVLTPQVTRINRIEIGMRVLEDGRTSTTRDVPEESLILTGDENIIDVDVSVFWKIKDAPEYLFNIQNPEATVKAVAEGAMREVIGRSQLQPVLTQARAITEQDVLDLIQQTLDGYKAGIDITQVQLQKVDPPAQVIDAFRDVQAARADQERLRNEAQAYANRIVPEARGQASQITQQAEAYRERTINEARGQADRFSKVYEEYRKAPAVTRERLFLETMERVLGQTDKIIIDEKAGGSGVVPYLPLDQINRQSPRAGGGNNSGGGQ